MSRMLPPWTVAKPGWLGIAAISYVAIDYLRHISPTWHERLQPAMWSVLVVAALIRVPFYKHWNAEIRAIIPFFGCMVFMLAALLFEMLSVRFVTAVLGLDWHRNAHPLPDIGQWLLLALNEKLPQVMVEILRARIIGLHHFLMLFMMLAFSVLFDSIKAPGFGLGARYMFTMGVGRLLRAISFVSTILPSARPWCATSRFQVPSHPHRWAQKYYVPYASDHNTIRWVLYRDMAYAHVEYIDDYRPDWGRMSFLIDFLRPITTAEGSAWYNLLKKAEGGCNDLLYSGHMLVAVLTAMAWTEACGGVSSVFVWLLLIHSAQREIRERYHYSVDCVVAIYIGILLWKMTGFIWSAKETYRNKRSGKFEKIQSRLIQAAKDSDMDRVKELLNEVELDKQEIHNRSQRKIMQGLPFAMVLVALITVVLALVLLSDG